MLRSWIGRVALAAMALATACTQDGTAEEAETRQENVPMKVSVSLRGDRDITIKDRTVEVLVAEVVSGNSDVDPTFGIQPTAPIKEGLVQVLPGFAVIPYNGDGRYTIKPGSPRDALEDSGGGSKPTKREKSSVRVEWWPADAGPEEYLKRVKPCTLEIDDNGMSGRLRCPELTYDGGTTPKFSLDFRWEKP